MSDPRVLLRASRIPESPCPYCGLKIDGAAYTGNEVPSPGDVAKCIRCGEFSEFGVDLTLQPMSALISELDPAELKKARELYGKMKAAGFR